jgi:hypothetical protein
MGPSEKTFNQVKNILGKLDRSIDQLRQARQTPATPPVAEARPAAAAAAPAPARPASQFGRATPLRP